MSDPMIEIAKIIDSQIESRLSKLKKDMQNYVDNRRIGAAQIEAGAIIPPKVASGTLDLFSRDINQNGVSSKTIISDSVAPRYAGAAMIYVNKSATDAQVEAGTHFRSLNAALNTLNYKQLRYDVTISILNAAYYEGVVRLFGLSGGHTLTIEVNDAMLSGTVFHISHCTASIFIDKLRLTQRGINDPGLWVVASQYVRVQGSRFSSLASGLSAAIQVDRGSNVYVMTSEMYGTWRAIRGNGSFIVSVNNKGDCRLAVDASIMIAYGTQPCDQDPFVYASANGGVIHQTSVTTAIDSESSTVAATETQTFAATTIRTINGSDEWPTTWMPSTDYAQQGYTADLERMVSALWFSGLSSISGKTVLSAKLMLRRIAPDGKNDGVKITAYYGTLANSAGGGAPSGIVTIGTLGFLELPQSGTFDLPTAAIEHLAGNSTGRCLALNTKESVLWNGKSYSENHARFAGVGSSYVPELEVTYLP